MKKSGGLVIGIKKKKKIIVAAPKGAPCASPVTVVNESSTTATTNTGNNAPNKSKHKLVIKPFEKPPSLPPDFYDNSLCTLRRAAVAVLRREPLLSIDVGEGGQPRRLSREELYRTVQDLIVHGYGKELYGEVIKIVNDAAGEVIERLDGKMTKNEAGYKMETIIAMLGREENNANTGLQEQRLDLLKKLHSVCRLSYAEEYLTFVRSIFLVLDR